MVTLSLPDQAKGYGFDHAELGWNPNGHEPPQLYGIPHFDVHFYMVTSATQMAIASQRSAIRHQGGEFPGC